MTPKQIMVGLVAPVAMIFLTTSPAWAFRVSPMVVTFGPSGSDSTQTFLLENNGSDKIAVQVEALGRSNDVNGKETRTPTDDFTIYPQQLVLLPNTKRNVRVTWVGDRNPKTELCYRLVVTQLPVNLKKPEERERKKGASLTFLMEYVASVYVRPGGVSPKVLVKSFRVLPSGRGELMLSNTGGEHQILKKPQVTLKADDGTQATLTEKQEDQMDGENLLPGGERRFVFELPANIVAAAAKPESVKAEVALH